MAIIIIKRVEPTNKVYKFTCMSCKSELEAKESDKHSSGTDRNNPWIAFDCPVCGHTNYLDYK